MEGGIAVLLLVIVVIVAAFLGTIFLGGIGALTGRRRKLRSDVELTEGRMDRDADAEQRVVENSEQHVVFHGADGADGGDAAEAKRVAGTRGGGS